LKYLVMPAASLSVVILSTLINLSCKEALSKI
jgi:hypothetical protein